jgi:hypothetical protein
VNPVIYTYTGKWVNPLDFKVEDFSEVDMAHGLANINRFNGHVKRPISVAQHSYFVSKLVEQHGPEVALQGLCHDGAEYVLGDVTKWLKHSPEMAAYREAEERTQKTIFRALNLPETLHPAVEEADRLMVRYEGNEGFGPSFIIQHPAYPPLTAEEIASVKKHEWIFWTWPQARQMFLDQYYNLMMELGIHPVEEKTV